MKLSYIALILLSAFCVLLGALYFMQPSRKVADWNRPNAEYPDEFPSLNDFFLFLHEDPEKVRFGMNNVVRKWQPGNAIMLLELLDWLRETPVEPMINRLLIEKLQLEKFDLVEARKRIWSEPVKPHPEYAEFKKRIFSQRPMDPKFAEYFDISYENTIRLDEIWWGGVLRDGIPPLENPKMLAADEADYLDDSNVVFGVAINGDVRAYPKRILAWHELFRDTIGGEPVAGVYCTLCGTVIIYKTRKPDGGQYTLGTSGLLYRSNKLMYDHATRSLWSTMEGKPVVGPLVGKGIQLPYSHVVTTTWGQWKKDHPQTTVLSLETGHQRDYSEGKAYDFYFANDELMFEVPKRDSRLKNKAEILAIRKEGVDEKLAISADFLQAHPVYHDQIGDHSFVVLTDDTGANRVYSCGDTRFEKLAGQSVVDRSGRTWTIREPHLQLEDRKLPRFPAHRAFWFGWFSAFPETRLVK